MADTTDLPKLYLYKIFTSGGSYLGLLPNVTSKFGYNQLINTAFAQMTITVDQSVDTASDDVEVLETENSLPITTEASANLTTERTPDLVGSSNSKALIANDRLIEVWEFSRYWPTGKLVFSGYISRWKIAIGGSEDITITCLSKGTDLNNYLTPSGTADTLDQSQTQGTVDALSQWEGGASIRRYGQTFKTGSVSNISKIVLRLYCPTQQTATVKLWAAPSSYGGTPLGTATALVAAGTDGEVTFTFATPISVSPNTSYFISIQADPAVSVSTDVNTWLSVYTQDDGSNPYANGNMWRQLNNGSFDTTTVLIYDIYFKTYSSANSTKKTYTLADVATILNDLMDTYVAAGGAVAKSGTYPATGKTATYTFNINTILEGIQKVDELGPSNYFWFVDPASNILYYQAAATVADHYMIKGRHIHELDIEATKEYIANVIYFTGGDDGSGTSSNVYVNVNDATSLVNNRRGLVRINDPKVTGTSGAATGRVLAQNVIDGNNAEVYVTEITVTDDTYDISLFTLGQMVGFEGTGTFIDRLLLQIVGIKRDEDAVTLSLGSLRKRATAQVEEIQSSLQATQTVDNPTTPS